MFQLWIYRVAHQRVPPPLPVLSFPPSPNQLVRKLDIRLLPCCFFLYFFSALDRGNLGNAKSAGLEKDLGFKANEYGILLTCFTLSFSLLVRPVLFFLCSPRLTLELTYELILLISPSPVPCSPPALGPT